ncbi:MAG: dynamin family protein [Pseudanabaenaceae cyanobacterium]|jgi:GTPase Era involved in 16S rRNA processing
MSFVLSPDQQQNLQEQVNQILQLIRQDAALVNRVDSTTVQQSLSKAVAPRFEIVFAGAFSAGKSMLINALLGRKLLYSAEGHATGVECQVSYAEESTERIVLTFLSEMEIDEQCQLLCEKLGIRQRIKLGHREMIAGVQEVCQRIIQTEGGESKSERGKQARALQYLLQGFVQNQKYIDPHLNRTFSMEYFQFTTLQEAASYARRGSNSAVLKKIEYYCHDELLKDGNVLVDTPGIDAPIKRDADLTFQKIQDPETSAVICLLKVAETGELSTEETELLEKIRRNPSIRDRVFYVFNRVDKAWFNAQLRQRLDRFIADQFTHNARTFKTSGLLGFYGQQLRNSGIQDRFGLDSIFAEEVQQENTEETPLFVSEFNRYCSSGKLNGTDFRIDVRSYESPNQNYVRILQEWGNPLIDHLIDDSGVESFRQAITRYLTEEKYPLLFTNLSDDLQPVCMILKQNYLEHWHNLEAEPQTVDDVKRQEIQQLSADLKTIGDELQQDVHALINEAVATNNNQYYEEDYLKLKNAMVARLDDLIESFSVAKVHQLAQSRHPRNSVVPLLAILAEGFYYLANELEDVLIESSREIATNFFDQLLQHIKKRPYYVNLCRLLGNDGNLENYFYQVYDQTCLSLTSAAQQECDRYVRERPELYLEGTVSLWQLRQTLQQSCRGYDYQSMIESEPAIRQLLKIDFEHKVTETISRTYRQTVNQILNTHISAAAKQQAQHILGSYDQALAYISQILDKEAADRLAINQQHKAELKTKIDRYNQAVQPINDLLILMQLDRKKLPVILTEDLNYIPQPVVDHSNQNISQNISQNGSGNHNISVNIDSSDINQANVNQAKISAVKIDVDLDLDCNPNDGQNVTQHDPITGYNPSGGNDKIAESVIVEPETYYLLNDLGEPNF